MSAPRSAGFTLTLPGWLAARPVADQIKALGGVFVVLLLLVAALVVRDNRLSTVGTAYVDAAGEMRMLSQRLARAAPLAAQGDAAALAQLREARDTFARLLTALREGGDIAGVTVPESPAAVQAPLAALADRWAVSGPAADRMLAGEAALTALGQGVAEVDRQGPGLLGRLEALAAAGAGDGVSAREVAASGQLAAVVLRLQRHVAGLFGRQAPGPEALLALEREVQGLRDLLPLLAPAGEAGRPASEAAGRLAEAHTLAQAHLAALARIVSHAPAAVTASQAAAGLVADSEALLKASEALLAAYRAELAERSAFTVILAFLIFFAIGSLVQLMKIYVDDSRRRTAEAERLRQAADDANRANQEAILRLMNELGDLADGDLTVTATVTEDITGAIADSINFTVEELRVLVRRIDDAARRVTQATAAARENSAELLAAAERQSVEIREAGDSVGRMAEAMIEVSGQSAQSAQVARHSLATAEKGMGAVQDSIAGMGEIRSQIQETAKRIKRLGESSQEIGEIVELISAITEQTNVLALNAAIQAASAGEAGRGFSVVAEEVQRLAERSAEASQQIAAIVRTIQADTQDAVTAMEKSTQGVVEGARLADAAGQTLGEIGQVSRELAGLIERISRSTARQAESAGHVAQLMQDILRITEQTTDGTQRTASTIEALAELATELKGSVAGFRVS